MRREKQELSREDCLAALDRGTSGVLAVLGDEDYPYAVPLSYVYCDSKFFFHCAPVGHKLDAIAKNSKVSFCVIDKDEIVTKEYTSYFRSVIAFGKARVLTDKTEKRNALEALAARYFPGDETGRRKEIDGDFDRVTMIELSVDHMTGKEAIELVRGK